MEIPSRFPSHMIDQGMDILSTFFQPRIHLLIDFEGSVDHDRLATALRLCLDAEPILACRFVPRWIRPYWARLSKNRLESTRLLQYGQNTDSFLADDFDEQEGPQVRTLITQGELGDRLLVKINHQVADAGGLKEFGYLLAKIYRTLKDDPAYRPKPNLGSRSLMQVYKRFLPWRIFGLLGRSIRELWGNLRPYKSMPWPSGTQKLGTPVYVFRHFSRQRMEAVNAVAIQHRATINDLVQSAMLRALVEYTGWSKDSALRLASTVDLRRYLPDRHGESICNLSSFYFVNLGYELGSTFTDTLARVKDQIDRLKTDYFGLSFAFAIYLNSLPYPYALAKILLRKVFHLIQVSGNMPIGFTNMGTIDEHLLDFGEPRVIKAMLATPANQPPMIVSGMSGFRDSLSFSMGFYESAVSRANIEEFFEILDGELPRSE